MTVLSKLKLQYHQSGDSRGVMDDVLLSSRGSHGVAVGDVIEVCHPDDVHHGLFLVSSLRDDLQTRDVISIEHSLAMFFKFQQHKCVCVKVVDKESVTLDLVELYFREQYLNRSDFHRFSQELVGNVLQVNKKITHSDMRMQVGELWRKGDKYSCGYVGSETKIVFRSSTAVVHICVQLSEEMWLFDEHGDLYFEKALKFLSKLFLNFWPEGSCNHDCTIVFFTRVLIGVPLKKTQYPERRDFRGRLFEDFYHVVVQNERLAVEEWKRVITHLKLEFKTFQTKLVSYLNRRSVSNDSQVPSMHISSASEGNILEMLNMALNLYAGYNVDRNLDRTGKSLIVVSPGSGCHCVESRLLTLTKQRVLDLGISVDLICLGQQPFHTVPIFLVSTGDSDRYVVPYWIDCSFFRSAHELHRISMESPINRTQVLGVITQSVVENNLESSSEHVACPDNNDPDSQTFDSPRLPQPVHNIIYPRMYSSVSDGQQPFYHNEQLAYSVSDTTLLSPSTFRPLDCPYASSNDLAQPLTTAYVAATKLAMSTRNAGLRSHGSDVVAFSLPLNRHGHVSVKTDNSTDSCSCSSARSRNSRSQSVVGSLPCVREHHAELMKSAYDERPCPHFSLSLATRHRGHSESFSSDADGSVSTASSSDSITNLIGGSSPQATRHQPIPKNVAPLRPNRQSITHADGDRTGGVAQAVPATPVIRLPRHRSIPSGSSHTDAVTHRTSRTDNRVKANNVFFPNNLSDFPFELTDGQATALMTAGHRRWVYALPLDCHGAPHMPHRNFSSAHSWYFPKSDPFLASFVEVWAAYFDLLKDQLAHSAPGGPILGLSHPNHAMPYFESVSRFHAKIAELIDHLSLPTSVTADPQGSSQLSRQTSGKTPAVSNTDGVATNQNFQRLLDAVQSQISRSSDPSSQPRNEPKFSSLWDTLQLIGVDWKSISAPVSLPIETDYFPDKSSLKSAGYTLHDYRVVPVGVTTQEWESTHDFDRQPGFYYCRRQLTLREVFYEMLLQRLSHGFQLCRETPTCQANPCTSIPDLRVLSKVGSPELSRPTNSGVSVNLSPTGASTTSRFSSRSSLTDQRASHVAPSSYQLRKQIQQQQQQGSSGPRLSLKQRNISRSSTNSPTTTCLRSALNTSNFRTIGVGLTLSVPSRTAAPLSRPVFNQLRSSRSGTQAISVFDSSSKRLPSPGKAAFKMSIGRLFHSISLEDDSITITNYRCRQADDGTSFEYNYALRVPDATSFHSLKTLFASDSTSGINWSYLDNYLCTRGVIEPYVLIPSLKFWRSRFVLVPIYTSETRRLAEVVKDNNGSPFTCDVYEADFRKMDTVKVCEKFVHFIESVNRVRRAPVGSRKSARQPLTDKPELGHRSREISSHNSASITVSSGDTKSKVPGAVTPSPSTVVSTQAVLQRVLSSFLPSSLDVCSARTMPVSSSDDSVGAPPLSDSSVSPLHSYINPPVPHLSTTSALSQITSVNTRHFCVALLMADAEIGLSFISASAFPDHTFLSYEAVFWTIKWLSDIQTISQAVDYLQTLLDAGWIRHASGNPSHTFIYGTYFYTLLVPEVKSPVSNPNDGLSYSTGGEALDLATHSTPVTPNPAGLSAITNIVSQSISNLANISPLSPPYPPRPSESASVTPGCASSSLPIQPIAFPEIFTPKSTATPSSWTVDFQTEWAEVAFSHESFPQLKSSPSPKSSEISPQLTNTTSGHGTQWSAGSAAGHLNHSNLASACGIPCTCGHPEAVLRKTCVCDFDDSTADSRTEWGHCVYDANYHPRCAFSIELQWLVASGPRVSELVHNWQHRSGTANFHFFPAPCAPFGYRNIRPDVDPLRMAIFVPIHFDPLLIRLRESRFDTPTSEDTLKSTSELDHSGPPVCPKEDCRVVDVSTELFADYPSDDRLNLLRCFQDHLLRK